MAYRTNRRTFIGFVGYGGLGLGLGLPRLVRAQSANERVQLAGIGIGGKGWGDINEVAKGNPVSPGSDERDAERVIALCDVNFDPHGGRYAEGGLPAASAKWPEAELFKDWRRMLDRLGKDIDGVTVSTPDHMHAPITMTALSMGIATYTQKPMTRTVHEARVITEAARAAGVATQMGNQGHSGVGYRMLVRLIQDGAIGKIRAVETWSDRPFWPHGMDRPLGEDPEPESLDWDKWLGVAPERPYKHLYTGGDNDGRGYYQPFTWRGWYDFGSGSLGDMGCHILDPVVWGLDLGAPTTVSYEGPEPKPEAFPTEETITYKFPGTDYTAGDEVVVKWHDGGRVPSAELAQQCGRESFNRSGGVYIGEKGLIYCPHGGGPQLFPREDFAEYARPRLEPMDHYMQWTNAIRGTDEATSHFEYAGPLTETVQLGVIASRVGEGVELAWDAANMRFANSEVANRFVRQPYRKGWEVEGL